jgi:hypothetical protein
MYSRRLPPNLLPIKPRSGTERTTTLECQSPAADVLPERSYLTLEWDGRICPLSFFLMAGYSRGVNKETHPPTPSTPPAPCPAPPGRTNSTGNEDQTGEFPGSLDREKMWGRISDRDRINNKNRSN